MREIQSGWAPSLRRELRCSRRGRKESPDRLRSNIAVSTEFQQSCGDDACKGSLYVHPSDLRLALVLPLGSGSPWTLPAASNQSVASLARAGGDGIEHYPESISNYSSQATSCRTLPHHTLRHSGRLLPLSAAKKKARSRSLPLQERGHYPGHLCPLEPFCQRERLLPLRRHQAAGRLPYPARPLAVQPPCALVHRTHRGFRLAPGEPSYGPTKAPLPSSRQLGDAHPGL